jgi:hypothetical protein
MLRAHIIAHWRAVNAVVRQYQCSDIFIGCSEVGKVTDQSGQSDAFESSASHRSAREQPWQRRGV